MPRSVRAIREEYEAAVEAAVHALSRSRRIFAPLVFVVGAFVMLFQGVRLLFSNWRLTLIQLLPAMWIWVALLDLKVHVFKGKEFHVWHGAVEVVLVVVIALLTGATGAVKPIKMSAKLAGGASTALEGAR